MYEAMSSPTRETVQGKVLFFIFFVTFLFSCDEIG